VLLHISERERARHMHKLQDSDGLDGCWIWVFRACASPDDLDDAVQLWYTCEEAKITGWLMEIQIFSN
jgi:uncharacterized membrane protein YebE (DUF533 family)